VPDLIAPSSSFHRAWLEAHREWGPGQHEDGFGLDETDEIETAEGFAAWIRRLIEQSDSTRPMLIGQAHCTYRWIVDGGEILGGIALRHELTDFVAQMGHVGYGIRPSARGRGVATWALGQMLDEAQTIGLERLLIVCEPENIASARVIEHHGGVPDEDAATDRLQTRRYWINVRGHRSTSDPTAT
jgi:predicted acetyltransferase